MEGTKVNKDVILAKKAQLEREIKEIFRSLIRIDRQRASYLQNYEKSTTPTVGLPEFVEATKQSTVQLEELEKLFF